MPKVIELTVEIVVQKVSCPGVWLCQDGMVSLIIFALGTSYETCMLPPTFPLKFNDRLYFRKRFQETCALSNICCLLKEETMYCELVQWSQNCVTSEPRILAQYLGSLNDVLFPPKLCCSDGVDLLMRRSKDYPGILSPKIEVATKVRIDEVWNDKSTFVSPKVRTCPCISNTESRQKPVCHSSEYHRNKCPITKRVKTCSRPRSRSGGSVSCSSLKKERFCYNRSDHLCKSAPLSPRQRRPCRRDYYCVHNVDGFSHEIDDDIGSQSCKSALPARKRSPIRRDYYAYNVDVNDCSWSRAAANVPEFDDDCGRDKDPELDLYDEDKKIVLESRYVDDETPKCEEMPSYSKKQVFISTKPCVCEICRRYHELFHTDSS